jgi:hypothetical protein
VDVKQREKRVKNSLRVSLRDGIFASIMSGIMDPYVVPFALFLGATVQEVGWISSAPQLVGSLAQCSLSGAGSGHSGIRLGRRHSFLGQFYLRCGAPPKRVRCISYFNVINGTALFLGASLGGLLASTLPPLLGYPLLTLFALSSLRRLVLYFLLFNRFSEVRPSKAVSLQELFFSVVGIRPLVG